MESVALVLGEAVADVVDGRAVPGGSAVITAVALARLGRAVRIGTSYAHDDHGRLIAGFLADSDVLPATDPHVVDHTCRAVATLRADGSADYRFDIDWDLAPVAVPAGEQPLVVHTSGFSALTPPGATTIADEFRRWQGSATVSYDLNIRSAITGTGPDVRRKVEELVALADVVKASDEDLDEIWSGEQPDEAARRLLTMGPSAVVVTRGAEGASWFTRDAEGNVSPVATRVADTIGAGDTFQGALLDALWAHGLLGGSPALGAADRDVWNAVVGWAAEVAAVTVSRTGGNPPWRSELGTERSSDAYAR